jgi:hypothetical protein
MKMACQQGLDPVTAKVQFVAAGDGSSFVAAGDGSSNTMMVAIVLGVVMKIVTTG